MPSNRNLRCLIFEKHDKETGFREEQVQIKKSQCDNFFGRFTNEIRVRFKIYYPDYPMSVAFRKDARIKMFYRNTTYRIVDFPELGLLPKCFIFIQETTKREENRKVYKMWFEKRDLPIIVAKFRNKNWQKAKDSGHVRTERGRLSVVINGIVPYKIDDIELIDHS
jgi:hypothetical protein